MTSNEQIQRVAQARYDAALLANKANRTAMFATADFISSADLYQCNWLMNELQERIGQLDRMFSSSQTEAERRAELERKEDEFIARKTAQQKEAA